MDQLLLDNRLFKLFTYSKEKDFESDVVKQAPYIFGNQSVYIDVKKRIGDSIQTIPDGYLIDFSFSAEPRLYIIENELAAHDPYRHIGSQLLKFAISYKASGRQIHKFILDYLLKHPDQKQLVETGFQEAGFRNIDAFLDHIIFEKGVAAIVIIDRSSPELENVLSQLTMDTDIIEFRAFDHEKERIFHFTPFNPEIRELNRSDSKKIKPGDLNTIVVPAQEEGFKETFLGEDSWYAIRMSASMLDKVKYIAAYQVAPISAITHFAEVATIEKYKDTNKYLLRFKDSAKELKNPVKLEKEKSSLAPQAPRYTSFESLIKARKLSDIFGT